MFEISYICIDSQHIDGSKNGGSVSDQATEASLCLILLLIYALCGWKKVQPQLLFLDGINLGQR